MSLYDLGSVLVQVRVLGELGCVFAEAVAEGLRECVCRCGSLVFSQTLPMLRKTSRHRWVPERVFTCMVCGGQMPPCQLLARPVGAWRAKYT